MEIFGNYIFLNKNKLKSKFIIIKIFSFITIIIILLKLKNEIISNIKNNHLTLSKKSIKSNIIELEFINNLKNLLNDNEILENEMMSKHTTFKLGGPAKFFVIPKTIKQISEIIQLCNKYKVHFFILGNGSNLLVSDNGYYGVVIQINESNFSKFEAKKIDENNYILKVGGGMLMKTLSIKACLLSLTGLEDVIDIPGTVGGGIIMNASFKGTGLREPLTKVKIITPEGNILELSNSECKFIHRGSLLKDKKYIVIEAVFKLKKGNQLKLQRKMTNNTKMRYEKQPMYFGSAGCFFVWDYKNHDHLYPKYKESNLIGYRIGNIMIYTYNISFIVNLGEGTASQVMEIVTHIEKIMIQKYKVKMRREVIVIGSFKDIEYY